MLQEFKGVRQEPGAGMRRWFEDEALSVVFWHDDEGTVTGFQIHHRFSGEERALTWRCAEGFEHSLVDAGESNPTKNLTPILLPDGAVPWSKLVEEFSRRCANLEPHLTELVLAHLASRR